MHFSVDNLQKTCYYYDNSKEVTQQLTYKESIRSSAGLKLCSKLNQLKENEMLREEVNVSTKGRDDVKFSYNFSENITEAVSMYDNPGDPNSNVHELFKRALTIAAQANARKLLSAGYTAESIQAAMDQWKPGVTISSRASVKTVDPVKVITENFDDWTPERQEEIFRLIQERFASRGQTPPAPAAANGSNEEPTEEEVAAITEGVNGDTEAESANYNPSEARRRR